MSLSTSHPLFHSLFFSLSLSLSHTHAHTLTHTHTLSLFLYNYLLPLDIILYSPLQLENDDVVQENETVPFSIRLLRFALLLFAYLNVTSLTLSIFRFSTNTLLSFSSSVFFTQLSSFYATLPHSFSPLSCPVFLLHYLILHSTRLLSLLLALYFCSFFYCTFLLHTYTALHCTVSPVSEYGMLLFM